MEEKEEGKKLSNWTDLPAEILELIIQKLFMKEYLRLCQLCSRWRNIIANAIERKQFPPLSQFPWLSLSAWNTRDHRFGSLNNHKVGTFRPRYTSWDYCVGSFEGWLILINRMFDASSFENYFLNPISGSRIMLPPKSNPTILIYSNNLNFFEKIVASSAPYCSDCIVAGCAPFEKNLGFCRIQDESWKDIESGGHYIVDIDIHDQRLYAITIKYPSRFIIVFDLGHPSAPKTEEFVLDHPSINQINISCGTKYIVKDSETRELFVIFSTTDYVSYQNTGVPLATGFQVFKLDIHIGRGWVEVDSLRNRVLFLSNKASRLIPSNMLNSHEDIIRGNCIYFSYPLIDPAKVGRFCMMNKSITYFPICEIPICESGGHLQKPLDIAWFMPKLW